MPTFRAPLVCAVSTFARPNDCYVEQAFVLQYIRAICTGDAEGLNQLTRRATRSATTSSARTPSPTRHSHGPNPITRRMLLQQDPIEINAESDTHARKYLERQRFNEHH